MTAMSVLVLIREQKEAAGLIRWGQRFAEARDSSLQVLSIKPGLQTLACHRLPVVPDKNNGDPLIQGIREVLDNLRILRQEQSDSGKPGDTHKSELPGLWFAVGQDLLSLTLEQIDVLNVDLLVLGKTEHGKHSIQNDVSFQLLQRAHCDVLVLHPEIDQEQPCEHIIVSMAGGPHSPIALRLAEQVAKKEKAQVTALYIQPESVPDASEQGYYHLKRLMDEAGVKESASVKSRVEVHNNVRQAINNVVSEQCDLLILGTSDHSAVSKMLFGTIDAHIIAGKSPTGVAVIRAARPLHSRIRAALEKFAHQQVPPMSREERIELSERLTNGSRCNVDYIALMFLATSIAALGLLQNSTAVVVGAMLVAPLMTPIIGAGLGLVQGNAVLVKDAAKAISIGFMVAIMVGFIAGFLAPGADINNELMARGNPNALDLGIAFFSGIAAAYALSRPNLSAALPGVAIAAALVPPIATVGICLAIGEFRNAQGAVLLFSTNVVAIIIGSAMVLHLLGMRAAKDTFTHLWAKRIMQGLLLGIMVLAIPLSSVFLARISTREVKSIEQIVRQKFEKYPHIEVQKPRIVEHDDWVDIRIIVFSDRPIEQSFHAELKELLSTTFAVEIHLEIMRINTDILN